MVNLLLWDAKLKSTVLINSAVTSRYDTRGNSVSCGISSFLAHNIVNGKPLIKLNPEDYNYRPATFISDELEFIVGFDQKIADGVTFSAEFLGRF